MRCPICDGPMVTADTVFYIRPEAEFGYDLARQRPSGGPPSWLMASRPLCCSIDCAKTMVRALTEIVR